MLYVGNKCQPSPLSRGWADYSPKLLETFSPHRVNSFEKTYVPKGKKVQYEVKKTYVPKTKRFLKKNSCTQKKKVKMTFEKCFYT